MRRFKFLSALVVFAAAAMVMNSCSSCDSKKDETKKDSTAVSIMWNVDAEASGEGLLVIGFPTGSMTLNGDAQFKIMTTNDTLTMVNSNMVKAENVLKNPGSYDSGTVEAAKQIENAFKVDTMSGKWNVDITGYARYDRVYFIIDEHWPKN